MSGRHFLGPTPEKWERTTLGEIVKRGGGHIQTGPFGSQLHASDYVPKGVPVIMPINISENQILEDGIARITEEDANRLARHRVQVGDIIYSRRGDVERRALIRQRQHGWLCGTGCLKVRLGRGVADPLFASYYLGHPKIRDWIVRHAVGATMPNLNTGIIERVPFALPPLPEQRAIAHILGTLDDKIEVLRRMSRTLEEMARAVFKSWFVDFDPVVVNALRAGNPIPKKFAQRAAHYRRNPGALRLPENTLRLFPDRFQNSELGPIPRGWRVTSLGDEITANKGLSYKGQHLGEGGEGLPMHNLNSVYEGGGYKHEGLKWYTGEYRPAHLLEPGDVIVTNTEQGFDHLLIGYAAIVPRRYGDKGLFSHHLYRVQAKPTSYLPTWFVYLLLRTPKFHWLVAGYSNGTTVNMLPRDALEKPRFVLPPKPLVQRFGKLFIPTQHELEQIYDETVTLAALRDALLPKLISGQLRVKDAEQFFKERGL